MRRVLPTLGLLAGAGVLALATLAFGGVLHAAVAGPLALLLPGAAVQHAALPGERRDGVAWLGFSFAGSVAALGLLLLLLNTVGADLSQHAVLVSVLIAVAVLALIGLVRPRSAVLPDAEPTVAFAPAGALAALAIAVVVVAGSAVTLAVLLNDGLSKGTPAPFVQFSITGAAAQATGPTQLPAGTPLIVPLRVADHRPGGRPAAHYVVKTRVDGRPGPVAARATLGPGQVWTPTAAVDVPGDGKLHRVALGLRSDVPGAVPVNVDLYARGEAPPASP